MSARLNLTGAAIAALALAGCNSQPSVSLTNASPEEVAAKTKAAVGGEAGQMSPGRWEATVKIDSVDMPGLPPEAQAQVKAQMGEGKTIISCLTPEEAKKGSGDFFKGNDKLDCTYDKFEMRGGTIDGAMTCKVMGTTQKSTMKGSYTATGYNMTLEQRSEGGAVAGGTTSVTIDAKRVGECKGDETGS